MTFVICDSAGVVQDLASQEANLSRGLPYLAAGGHQYTVASLDAWIGDHFDGTTLTQDSPLRAQAVADALVVSNRTALLTSLLETEAYLEADVGALTLANVQGWRASIDNVYAQTTIANFRTQWRLYEKKHTLFILKLVRQILTGA
jgi:hypothetical protein